MNTAELGDFVARLSNDLSPAAEDDGGLGTLLVNAEAIVDDEALLTAMTIGFRLATIGDYLMAAAANRAQAVGVPVRRKLKTGRDLLRQLPLAPVEVFRLGRLGDNLAALPNLTREVRDGDLSLAHADAVIQGIAHVASRMDVDGFATEKESIATTLLGHARIDSPAQVAAKARELGHRFGRESPPTVPAAENRMLNHASVTTTPEGRVCVEADLDQLSGEKLITALDALARPCPAPDGGRDPRTREQRMADALVEMVETYLAHPGRPTNGGVVPHINVTVPLPVLIPESPLGADQGSASVVGDTVAHLGFTGPVSAGLAREICCGDTELAAIVTADGIPLEMTRHQRLATGALRQALIARDHGCQFPGCGKPSSWTQAHHIREWADGGETTLDNLVLLCSFHHHTAIHAQGWKVRIGSDRHPWFRAPEGGDWMHSHHRRTLTLAAHAAT